MWKFILGLIVSVVGVIFLGCLIWDTLPTMSKTSDTMETRLNELSSRLDATIKAQSGVFETRSELDSGLECRLEEMIKKQSELNSGLEAKLGVFERQVDGMLSASITQSQAITALQEQITNDELVMRGFIERMGLSYNTVT